jgi:catecholate siderophore receptor
LFATDRFWFTEQRSLIAGVRVDQYKAKYDTVLVNGTAASAKSPSTLVNPRASLVFEPDETQTYYFSWGRSSTPQGTSVVGSPTPISATNQTLDPEKSENLEIGAKISLFDGGLGLSGSLFQVTKSNATIRDTDDTVIVQSGQRQRVRGLELSATGYVTENWSVLASYTYLDPVITDDPVTPYNIGRQITFVPKNAASFWTDYKATSLLEGLELGGGIVYQSSLYNGYTAPSPSGYPLGRIVRIPETVELDAVASYEFANYRIALNVNNITDRLNYAQSFGNRGTPAAGRTFIVSLDAAL